MAKGRRESQKGRSRENVGKWRNITLSALTTPLVSLAPKINGSQLASKPLVACLSTGWTLGNGTNVEGPDAL